MSLLWTCRDVIPLLTEYEEGTLSWYQRLRLRLHLWVCPDCKLLYHELKAIPPLVEELTQAPTPELKTLADAALRGALDRIQAGRFERIHEATPSTETPEVGDLTDPTLHVLETTYRHLLQAPSAGTPPYLPSHVLAHLPQPERWKWHRRGTARVATLLEDGSQGARLSLLVAPKGFQAPRHTHEGTETMLILEGVMEDGDRVYRSGSWLHFDRGTTHAPVILNDECWCLIREVGPSTVHGPLGWLQRLMA